MLRRRIARHGITIVATVLIGGLAVRNPGPHCAGIRHR